MRWTWLDLIVELKRGQRCVGIRNVTWAEDVLSDHFDVDDEAGHGGMPVMPNTLVIEGMAQAAGILVGHYHGFREKVLLAKIARASFGELNFQPGTTIRHTATLDRIDDSGASTSGLVELIRPGSGEVLPYGSIDLMFSHIDRNRKGLAFPEHNFVFTGHFMELLERSGFPHRPERAHG